MLSSIDNVIKDFTYLSLIEYNINIIFSLKCMMKWIWVIVSLFLIALIIIAVIYGKATTKYNTYEDLPLQKDINLYKVKEGDICNIKEDCPDGFYCSGRCVNGPYGGELQYCPCREGLSCVNGPSGTWVCSNVCTTNADCPSDRPICYSNVCIKKVANASPCLFNEECESNNCSYNFCQPQGIVSGLSLALCFPGYPDPRTNTVEKPGCSSVLTCEDGFCQTPGLTLGSVCNKQDCIKGLECLTVSGSLCSNSGDICYCSYPSSNDCKINKCPDFLECVNNNCLNSTGLPCQTNSSCASGTCLSNNSASLFYFLNNGWVKVDSVPPYPVKRFFVCDTSSLYPNGNTYTFSNNTIYINSTVYAYYLKDLTSGNWQYLPTLLQGFENHFIYPRISNKLSSYTLWINKDSTTILTPLLININPSIGQNPITTLALTNIVEGDINNNSDAILQDKFNNLYLVTLKGYKIASLGLIGSKPRYCSTIESMGFAYIKDSYIAFGNSEVTYKPEGTVLDLSFYDQLNGIFTYKNSQDKVLACRVKNGNIFPIPGEYSEDSVTYYGSFSSYTDFTMISSNKVCK